MDFVLGGMAAMGAGFFSNPLDVVKTRMQLQGELKAKGNYSVHYKNVPHALYTIARADGILALQRGLVPALGFQLICNSTRLGIYETANNRLLLTRKANGKISTIKSSFYAGMAGAIGGILASPMYLIKTQMQSMSDASVAVGYQHHYSGTLQAFRTIFGKEGLKGLWRGVESAVPRAGVGSAVQLTTFTSAKELLDDQNILIGRPVAAAFVSSVISGASMVIFMCPFDVISTRLYNQEVGIDGKGRLYSGVFDCGFKIIKAEGLRGVYKGIGPFYLRVAPHSVLCLIFWDRLKSFYKQRS